MSWTSILSCDVVVVSNFTLTRNVVFTYVANIIGGEMNPILWGHNNRLNILGSSDCVIHLSIHF